MGWNTLLPNQCISFNNLQDACNLGLFVYSQPIPVSTEQITKQNFEDYIILPTSVSQYPPFVNKSQNQLVVKDNIALYGGATLVPNYGISFTGIYYTDFTYQSPVGIWSLPASSTQTSQYYSEFGGLFYPYLYIEVDGTSTSPSGFFSVTLSVNGNVVSTGTFSSVSGPQAAIVFLNNEIIYAPNNIELTIIDGQATPINVNFQDQNGGIPITAVSASRGSGQYQMVATGSAGASGLGFLQGKLYRSIDYGATWQASSTNTLYYWQRIAMSDTGQYMIASSLNGPLFLSTNYGASYTDITTRIRGNATEYFEGTGMSGNGQYIVVCYEEPNGTGFSTKISNNYGASGSWSLIEGVSKNPVYGEPGQSVQGVAISNDGQFIYLSYTDYFNGVVYKSSNYGANATWQTVYPGTQYVRDISCSSDGSTVVVTGAVSGYGGGYVSRGFMFKSTNYGASFTGIQTGNSYLRNWTRVGQLYTSTSPSGYGTVMTYAGDYAGQLTDPSETFPVGSDSLGSVILSNVTGMGLKVFTDCAVGGTDGPYRLLGSTTGLFRSTTGGGSWTQL
jgi:hypothetical protein